MMSGVEPFLASLFAAAGTSGGAAGGAAAATTAAAGAGAVGGAGVGAAGAAGLAAANATAAGGLSATTIASLAGAGASLAGTGAQLLAGKPELPRLPGAPTRDDARAEADRESELLKRRGRAAALLTAGGARGDTSTPSLGAAALLGA